MNYTYEEALENIEDLKIGDRVEPDKDHVGEHQVVALGGSLALVLDCDIVLVKDGLVDVYLDKRDIQEMARAISQGQARGQVAPGVAG